jgi:hypothetical protein
VILSCIFLEKEKIMKTFLKVAVALVLVLGTVVVAGCSDCGCGATKAPCGGCDK